MGGLSSMSRKAKAPRRALHATALGLLAAGFVGIGSAQAGVATQEFRFNLRYAPAELASPEGAERLYRRIQYAARRACGEFPGSELKQYFIAQRCYERAVEAAVAKVNEPALTSLHHSRAPRTAAG